MFGLQVPAWEIVIRTAVVYLVILVGLRLAGKREVGQLTVIDLVVLLLISNAVQNAMLGPDTSLLGGIIAVVVLLTMSVILASTARALPTLEPSGAGFTHGVGAARRDHPGPHAPRGTGRRHASGGPA